MSNVANPKLWKSIKEKWHRGSKGGTAGTWNARKAQLAVQEYKRRGGKYKTARKSTKNSLVVWTKEDWGYIDGKKGNRYLPKKVREQMTKSEKQRENRRKRRGTKRGQTKVPYSSSVLKKYQKVHRKTGGGSTAKRPTKRGGKIHFADHPEFQPTLSPRDMFKAGVFGGTYWRPIKSGVTGKNYKNKHREFPASWWRGLDEKTMLTNPKCNPKVNKYKETSGTSLKYWECKKWIKPQDPYGWVQWYCRFYMGRRTKDDKRQIDRWLRFAGPKGRFRLRLINMIKKSRKSYNDRTVSPTIRQGLLQWAYELNAADFRAAK